MIIEISTQLNLRAVIHLFTFKLPENYYVVMFNFTDTSHRLNS